MSWLTKILRNVGLSGPLDAIEAAEAKPSAQTIGAAVVSVASSVPGAVGDAPVALADLGTLVGQTVIGAAQRVNPALGTIAAAAVPGILTTVEDAVLAALHLPEPPQAHVE
jgi:hypothetical protein